MTEPNQAAMADKSAPEQVELLAVTQADRDAAAQRYRELAQPGMAEEIEAGEQDDHPTVQMLARHRIQSQERQGYVAVVPPDCDRIVWRGSFFSLAAMAATCASAERSDPIADTKYQHLMVPGYLNDRAQGAIASIPDERKLIDWQPIETAPRDGTIILAYGEKLPTYFYAIVWENGEWRYCSQGRGWSAPPDMPTHWRQLPEPPERGQHISATVEG